MLKLKSLVIVGIVGIVLAGCGAKEQLPLGDVVGNSYRIVNDMNQSMVSAMMPMKPTSMQRINGEEIWKYEGDVTEPKTKSRTYHNLIVKFIDGKVKHVGTFSCRLPVTAEE
ncbi:MAG: hypothetical protein Q8M43_07775 [Sulfuricurvum sp.]|uniref:hypothetical protein n=1 Tax=Sulfuricurvum sp. TaxID=2025608 RepID=UPI002736008E|nr:hypothetical protein [Sulfuricurvum sp.]MDP3291912.1 hypothetical protein [Sulfuricurvum sp.]